jgi:1-acyl-sn-glycerol-3-phosphate acyltransferase
VGAGARRDDVPREQRKPAHTSVFDEVAWRVLRPVCHVLLHSRLHVTVEGIEHLPSSGPLIIASRHYHNAYDGLIMLSTIPRQTHIMVAVDWVQHRRFGKALEWLARAGRWPAVLRPDRVRRTPLKAKQDRPPEATHFLRQAWRMALDLLREQRVLVIFPEAYPNLDPFYTPKQAGDQFLPFRAGFVRLARQAQRQCGKDIPIVPTGLYYDWGKKRRVVVRFGEPVVLGDRQFDMAAVRHIEAQVQALSAPSAKVMGAVNP